LAGLVSGFATGNLKGRFVENGLDGFVWGLLIVFVLDALQVIMGSFRKRVWTGFLAVLVLKSP